WHSFGTGIDGSVQKVVFYSGDLIIGGSFGIDGVKDGRVARWDDGRWKNMGVGLSGPVNDLHVHDGTLYACGRSVVMRWNRGVWQTASEEMLQYASGAGYYSAGTTSVLSSFQGVLYVGGSFDS